MPEPGKSTNKWNKKPTQVWALEHASVLREIQLQIRWDTNLKVCVDEIKSFIITSFANVAHDYRVC